MSLQESQKLFEDTYLKHADGDVFQAINNWSDDTAVVKSKVSGRLHDSEILTSLLTHKIPEDTFKRKRVSDIESTYVSKYINEVLTQVDDVYVRWSVLVSLQESKLLKNLVFKYHNSLTNAQKARVRVISKLVWYNLYPKGVKNVRRN